MIAALPFTGVDRRVAWLRAILLSATLLGIIASAPLWFNNRLYPLLPIASGFPILAAPWDKGLFGAMLAALIAAMWYYRPAVICFLATSFFAFCQDQNRGQPWLYMYWVMLLLTLFPPAAAIAACRIAMFAVYFWSGVQKLNARFFEVAPDWFIAPAVTWGLPALVVRMLHSCVAATPFIEIAIGLALWIPRTRQPAVVAVAALHAAVLLFLGPLGHKYNWVVWPWNLAMVGLIWALFGRGKLLETTAPPTTGALSKKLRPISAVPAAAPASAFSFTQTLHELLRSKIALGIVSLYALLPTLSFAGKWDSGFSFALYSESQAVANVFVSKKFGECLPPELQRYFGAFSQNYDPARQNPYTFGFQAWCYETLRVPPIPESRAFRGMFHFLGTYAERPEDLRMIFSTRGGPVVYLEGDRVELMQPSK